MQNGSIASLLDRAKEKEKEYEWFQASKFYKQASEILLKGKDFVNAAELAERLGYCYFKASDQAETNKEFRKLMEQAVDAYKKEIEILEGAVVENKRTKINHAQASIAYVKALLERRPLEKKKLLDEWWTLENKVISAYEEIFDFCSAGKVSNEILDNSRSGRYWLVSNHSEFQQNWKEYINLAEKTILIFSKIDDEYELARAYFLATFYYSFSLGNVPPEKEEDFKQKSREYSKKALDLSNKIGNPYLIGESLRSYFWGAQQYISKDSKLMIENYKKAIKYGKIAKNNYVIAGGNILLAHFLYYQAFALEDPFKQKENYQQAIKSLHKVKRLAEISENIGYTWLFYRDYNNPINGLASIETDSKTKQDLLEIAIKNNQEGMERLRGFEWLSGSLLGSMSGSLQLLSKTKSEIKEKRDLLQKAEFYIKESISYLEEMFPFMYVAIAIAYFKLASIDNDLATLETENKPKLGLLKLAITSLEKGIALGEGKRSFGRTGSFLTGGEFYALLGSLLVQIDLISKQGNTLSRAVESYKKATLTFEKAEMPNHAAESNWRIAQIYDKLSEFQKASNNYVLAAKAYELSSKKMPQLEEFFSNYSKYMKAWSQIEQAKYFHSMEEYNKAQQHYEKAAELHESTEQWNYLGPNYSAWAIMEEAESFSRSENTQQAKVTFQKALGQFTVAEKAIKEKIGEITSADEKEMTQKLLQTSNLRHKYCQARVLMENAKLLDREGKYLQSSKSYAEAAKNILAVIERTEAGAERKEFEYLAVLCRAWEKVAVAEERNSSESFLEAAELFEEAKDYCYTKKATLWALGNSNFCRGLAAENQFQNTLDRSFHSKANKYVKQAATYYKQAGFQSASDYAKATQRLFDAYLYMNSAEDEVIPEKKTKFYQLAEQLLQIAANLFTKAKQPEKTSEVQEILATVREEKALASSLNEVLHAPASTSSTLSFTAPTPTSETSFGVESFEHANVQANLVVGLKEVRIGESFCLSVEFVNAGKEPALLTRVEDFIPSGFVVVEKPEIYRLEESCLNMKGKQIAPLKLVEAKVVLQPSKKGLYQLNPRVHYLDENGQNKLLQLKSVEIQVEEVVLADRVSTGTKELDALLLGGIPEECAVVLTGPPTDERELVIKNFLQTGTGEGHTSFYAATEAAGLEALLEKPNFYLFLCNPRPKVKVPDLPTVYKLHSKSDINNLHISLVKANRTVDQSSSKRICVNVVTDVLVEYRVRTTRKWLAELTTDLISKGFIILAVINPQMHTPEELSSVLDLFDGEISLTQTKDALECKKSIRIEKLRNQDYLKNPICLTKKKV